MNNGRLVIFDLGSGHKLEKLSKLAADKKKLVISFDMTRDTAFCPRSKLLLDYKRDHNLDVYKLKENLFFVHQDVSKISKLPWAADYVITRPLKTNNGPFPSNIVPHLKGDCAVFIRPEMDRINSSLEYMDYMDEIKSQLSEHDFKFVSKDDSLIAVRGNISG